MKLSTAISYRFKYQIKSSCIFLVYFLVFAVGFPLIGVYFSSTNNTVSTDALIPGIIFMIILAFFGISTDFKLFIQNGMSRLNIFLSSLISNAILATVFSIILMLFTFIAGKILPQNFHVTIFLIDIYTKNNFLLSFLFLFTLLLFASAIGSVAGTFNDRVTGLKKLIILGLIVIIPILISIIIQIISPELKASLLTLLKSMIGLSENGLNATPFILTLFFIFLALSIITYLMNINREIKRVNG